MTRLALLLLTIPALAQTKRIVLIDAGMVCPGDHLTGETDPAPGTERGTAGYQRPGTRIEVSTDIIAYARDASFGPEVMLLGTALHQRIHVEVDRPDYDGSTLTESYDTTLYPDDPRPLIFTFNAESTRLYGYWEWRIYLEEAVVLTHAFHVVRPDEAPDLLAACLARPIS
ncbi:hypothetical protein V8J83_15695 [Gymnodinialimonas sp. 2307UL20-7]